MAHESSAADRGFRAQVETGEVSPAEFNHRAHLRLAYIYLTEVNPDAAHRRMSDALRRFLEHHGIDRSKYHETLTRAWILAVAHFMARTPHAESADSFIDQNPRLLDSKIMMTHYSAEVLFSDEARARFVEPNLSPIPRYGS
jgi:hypothetical protein